MKRISAGILALIASAGIAVAEDVKPDDVVFDGGAVAASLTGAPGNAENGAKYLDRKWGNCVACHQVSASKLAFQGNIAPSLDGVADRWSEAELRGIVANAKMTFEGTMMPAFYRVSGYTRPGDAFTGKAAKEDFGPLLTAAEVEDIVAFLLTLKE
jgi:sulfur-oxidizing protein SoxX